MFGNEAGRAKKEALTSRSELLLPSMDTPEGQPPKERNEPRMNHSTIRRRECQGGSAQRGGGSPQRRSLALPAAPQRGAQGRGGGRGRTSPTRQQQRAREPPNGRNPSSADGGAQQAREGAGAQPKGPGGRAQKKRPEGPPGPPGPEATAPEAAKRTGRGGPGGPTRSAEASPERSKGDRSEAKEARSAERGEPKRSGGSEWPRRPAGPHKRPSVGAGGEGPGGGPGDRSAAEGGRTRRTGAAKRRRARRAGAAPRRGRGPGASGDAECAKKAAQRAAGAHTAEGMGPLLARPHRGGHAPRGHLWPSGEPGHPGPPVTCDARSAAATPQHHCSNGMTIPLYGFASGLAPQGPWGPVARPKAAFCSFRCAAPLLDTRTLLRHPDDGSMSKSIQEIGGNAILYQYPNGDFDIVASPDRSFVPSGWEEVQPGRRLSARPQAREKDKRSEGADMDRSMRRARAKLRRMALANEFEYFVTLTLDKEKIDRYDPKAIMQRVNRWLDNMVRRHGLRYFLVPEQHKDGAFHFHGFFAGEGLQIVDSGHQHDGRTVYNLPQWAYGFSNAQRLYGTYSAAVGYVCKYIGKQDGARPMGRWYYSGGALKEPPKEYMTVDYRDICEQFCGEAVEFEIPGSRICVIHHREETT